MTVGPFIFKTRVWSYTLRLFLEHGVDVEMHRVFSYYITLLY